LALLPLIFFHSAVSTSSIVFKNGTNVYFDAENVLKAASVNVLSPVIAVDQLDTVRFHMSMLNGVHETPLPPKDSKALKSKVDA